MTLPPRNWSHLKRMSLLTPIGVLSQQIKKTCDLILTASRKISLMPLMRTRQKRIMGQRQRSTKGVSLPHGKGAAFEHNETVDDSLLPKAEELAKLKAIDPTIIEWIKQRTEKEQDSRLKFNEDQMDLLRKHTLWVHWLDLAAMLFALLVVFGGMAFSWLLISNDHTVGGSLFAGGTLLAAANVFFRIRKKRNGSKPEERA